MFQRFQRRMLSRVSAALLVAVALAALLALPAFAQDDPSPDLPSGDAPAAHVVVQTGDGLLVRAITITQPISGLAVLQASGLDVTVADTGFGPAVCAIEGTGCPAEDCFCGGSSFWNYGFWNGESWEGYQIGASDSAVEPAGVEIWRWGEFTGTVSAAAWPAIGLSSETGVLPALEWLQAQQSPTDGGYGSMSGAIETMYAIGANGLAARGWQIEGGTRDLQLYARIQQSKFARDNVAAAGKLAVALSAADACWNGRARLAMDYYDESAGLFSTDSGFQAWGILGTAALSQTVPAAAVDALKGAMLPEGGWEWQSGFGPDSNTTALAIQALVAAGEPVTSTEVVSGLAYLRSLQQPDGGFPYDAGGTGSDVNSTAYAIMAIHAASQDAGSLEWSHEEGGSTPLAALLRMQLEDGSFEWQEGTGSNLFATQQAIPALLGRSYPIRVKEVERCGR